MRVLGGLRLPTTFPTGSSMFTTVCISRNLKLGRVTSKRQKDERDFAFFKRLPKNTPSPHAATVSSAANPGPAPPPLAKMNAQAAGPASTKASENGFSRL